MKSNAFTMSRDEARTRRVRLGRLATRLAVVLGIVWATPIGAGAVTLVAPLLNANGGTLIMCTATNAGTSPAQVVITGRSETGAVNTGFNFCGSELAPGASCYAYIPNDTPASCSFEVRGRIHAAAVLLDSSNLRPVLALPATK